ncbi:esterase family protein [Yinghuangia sp. ASG 101]|uniref:alpha/beta hydrolase n=1 Tax=Yinghuangia sp. ASG 101 TaxID=2896848 RepID=UPI001E637898|nr:alpha/beta hydrolase family protein [Yinghuangia sp. ASG 101]UGQ11765.1 esterase family protein [Yinghuangia sp. ASG 101]
MDRAASRTPGDAGEQRAGGTGPLREPGRLRDPVAGVPVSGPAEGGAAVRLSPRMVEHTLFSDALGGTTTVRVLLPAGYDDEHERRYPVVHLLHGGGEDATSWSDPRRGDAEKLTAGAPVIAVMPDGGRHGFYVDWFHGGAFGTPRWETYHMRHLVPWVDAVYRTIPRRAARATAGGSMGGHGALAYAARHPDLIGAAASFSGAVDIANPGLTIHAPAQLALTEALFGTYARHEVRWRGRNACDLAANLAHTDVSLYVGDSGDTEVVVNACARAVHQKLDDLGIRHRFTVHTGLGHDWDNFQRSFADWLPRFTAGAADRPEPVTFTRTSVEPRYGYAGWTVHMARDVAEFSALEVHGSGHFTLTGNGSATVVTPVRGLPGACHDVETRDTTGRSPRRLTADHEGRLSIPLRLGPGNPLQQFSPEADAASTGPSPDPAPFPVRGNGSRFHRTEVRVSPTDGPAPRG